MAVKLGLDRIPLYRVVIAGFAVGHSAHVSARGYIPATPVPAPGHRLVTAAAWLDATALDALDATEPNYDRRTVTTPDHLFQHEGSDFSMYFSRHGALADPDTSTPLAFGTQQTVIDWLYHRLTDDRLAGTATDVCARLADPAVARSITAQMRTLAACDTFGSEVIR